MEGSRSVKSTRKISVSNHEKVASKKTQHRKKKRGLECDAPLAMHGHADSSPSKHSGPVRRASDPQRPQRSVSLQSNNCANSPKTSKAHRRSSSPVAPKTISPPSPQVVPLVVNESLRWEYTLEDPIAEAERIQQYKANRRKRYLAAYNLLNNTGWVSSSSSSGGSSNSLTTPPPRPSSDCRDLPDVVMSSVTPSQVSDSHIILECP